VWKVGTDDEAETGRKYLSSEASDWRALKWRHDRIAACSACSERCGTDVGLWSSEGELSELELLPP
jgi:hypothetical protein